MKRMSLFYHNFNLVFSYLFLLSKFHYIIIKSQCFFEKEIHVETRGDTPHLIHRIIQCSIEVFIKMSTVRRKSALKVIVLGDSRQEKKELCNSLVLESLVLFNVMSSSASLISTNPLSVLTFSLMMQQLMMYLILFKYSYWNGFKSRFGILLDRNVSRVQVPLSIVALMLVFLLLI